MNNTSDVWLNIEEVCSLTNSKKETILALYLHFNCSHFHFIFNAFR